MTSTLSDQARQFLLEQDRDWPMLRENRALLLRAPVRVFAFDGFSIRVQLNLGRLSFAHKRPGDGGCFLCDDARPPEQRFISVGGGFRLMCNPYPILPEHFTIVHERHTPQRLPGSMDFMLDLARRMSPAFTVFYNGPQSGASAPDHLHLQAGPSQSLPAVAECPRIGRMISQTDGCRLSASDQYLRHFIAIESDNRGKIIDAFNRAYAAQHALQPDVAEPRMNVLCTFENGTWRMIIFPRSKHRPAIYFEPEDRRLLLSPGAIDVSGVLIVPVEEHFLKITREQVVAAYEDVTLARESFAALVDSLG